MRYGYLYTRKHMMMKFILERYQSDSELKECYLKLLETKDIKINTDCIYINNNVRKTSIITK